MKLKSNQPKASAEQVVKDIRRATRRHYSTEDKIRIVLSGLRGEDSIAELCRKEGIAQGLYYSWSKEFLEAGKKRLAGASGAKSLGSNLGLLAAVLAMPLDRASRTSPIFSARGFEDEVFLVAMDLLLDAYMQWFHIGSYRLAEHFFSAGWVGASHG